MSDRRQQQQQQQQPSHNQQEQEEMQHQEIGDSESSFALELSCRSCSSINNVMSLDSSRIGSAEEQQRPFVTIVDPGDVDLVRTTFKDPLDRETLRAMRGLVASLRNYAAHCRCSAGVEDVHGRGEALQQLLRDGRRIIERLAGRLRIVAPLELSDILEDNPNAGSATSSRIAARLDGAATEIAELHAMTRFRASTARNCASIDVTSSLGELLQRLQEEEREEQEEEEDGDHGESASHLASADVKADAAPTVDAPKPSTIRVINADETGKGCTVVFVPAGINVGLTFGD